MNINNATRGEIEHFIANNPQWGEIDNKLNRNFIFNNFSQAFAFMTEVAMLAEVLQHHPEWSNIYKKVSISLTTHEVGGITAKDFELAEKIDNVLKK